MRLSVFFNPFNVRTMENPDGPTTAQALETYRRTLLDEERHNWATWVVAVHNSLSAGEWIGGDIYPKFAKEVWEELSKDTTVSHSR